MEQMQVFDAADHARIRIASERVLSAAKAVGVDIMATIGEFMPKLLPTGDNVKAQLDSLRQDLGEEMFSKVVGGGSAIPILDRWLEERRAENSRTLQDYIMSVLKEKGVVADPSDISSLMMLISGAASR